jgi:hypothetical protein
MSAADTRRQSVAVIYLTPFDEAARLPAVVTFLPARDYGLRVEALAFITTTLLEDLARKEAEIERLRREVEDSQQRLNDLTARTVGLLLAWGGAG